MGFKEILERAARNRKEKKEIFKRMQEQDKMENMLEERKKSSNQRELERYIKEEREKQIKEQLDFMRKKRRDEIAFGSQPLNIKNITNHTDWEVLKEKNQFAKKGNMFSNQPFIHKTSKNLMKSGNVLHGRSNLFKNKGDLI
jgi:hypothetical protein